MTGQLSPQERAMLREAVVSATGKPAVLWEVGTGLGGGSTLQILDAIRSNGIGHLWSVESDVAVFKTMLAEMTKSAPECLPYFTPILGRSETVLSAWIRRQPAGTAVDFAFLDGGDNPAEQIREFRLLDPVMPVGARLLAHDANMRKGKWLVPYLHRLDHWESRVHRESEVGMLEATKTSPRPTRSSRLRAEAFLVLLRLSPAEIAAALLPSAVNAAISARLPPRVRTWFYRGRRPDTKRTG